MSPLLPLSLLCCSALLPAHAQAPLNDPALNGCWRTQHVTQFRADGSSRSHNQDCVIFIDDTRMTSRCSSPPGGTTSDFVAVSAYRLTAPGRYSIQPVASSLPQAPREAEYSVDGDWLKINMALPPRHNADTNSKDSASDKAATAAVRLQSLSVRVRPSDPAVNPVDTCLPRGASATRVGKGAPSSLRVAAPEGFTAITRDLQQNPELAQIVGNNTLLGLYVPSNTPANERSPRRFLVAMEDTRSGAEPVKPADFPGFKKVVQGELNATTMARTSQRYLGVSCDTQDRLCIDAAQTQPGAKSAETPPSGYVSAVFTHALGRVVVIYSVGEGRTPDTLKATQRDALQLADVITGLNR